MKGYWIQPEPGSSGVSGIPAGKARAAFVDAYLSHAREVPQKLADFLDEEQNHPRAWATKAIVLTTLARAELVEPAKTAAKQAQMLLECSQFDLADHAFVSAASHAAHGRWREAIDALERAIARDPADSLAVKMSHALLFMLGDAKGMLASINTSLARLPSRHPHRGFLLGCKAFALEENGFYAEAERLGVEAVTLRPDDAWGLHAVSHVHEMTGRIEKGISWIMDHEPLIRASNNFGGHLFWHLALFRLEQGRIGDALKLYDSEIRRDRTDDFRDIANAASLLMRIELDGHSVGDRWEELADKAEARIADRSYVFADLHYALALVGAGRKDAAMRLGESLSTVPPRVLAQEEIWHVSGRALGAGVSALARGDSTSAFGHFMRASPAAQRIGGSHAQRDVIEQMLVEAGLRAGEDRIVRKRLQERLAMRGGTNRFAETRLGRLFARSSAGSQGVTSLVAVLVHGVDPAAHHV
ncbi:Tetratricopeptide repeat protein 38 [Rhabdaerophilaceae bacterium]